MKRFIPLLAAIGVAGGALSAMAVASSIAIKASSAASSTAPDGERVLLNVAPAAPTSTPLYPTLLADGAADGVPYGLRAASVDGLEVGLSWQSPEPTDGIWDDFEDHDDFTINSPGAVGWQYIDGDNARTYTWQACSYNGMGQPMAFIVMNPATTTPAVSNYPGFQPFSGTKMLVAFCAVGTQNNDYIISPQLSFDSDFHVSLRARSYTSNYALERLRIGYSTTGTRQSDFQWVQAGDYVEVPAEWTLLDYQIPAEAKYVAINCVSDAAFMLLIDDIFIGTNRVRPGIMPKARIASNEARLIGFNVYRDGQRVNSSTVTEVRFTDEVDDYGAYSYTVSALYSDGSESEQSAALVVDVPDERLLPFNDDFSTWSMDTEGWTVSNLDGLTEHHWSVSYFTTGLVDPCLTYGFSSQRNYNQAVTSRELHTLAPDSTYLRFNIKLQSAQQPNTDYLDCELSTDGGATWQSVVQFTNTAGEFDWRTVVCPLKTLLNGNNLFQIRFRAHGSLATYIDYWYVDDVKVWNPIFSSATLTAATLDGPLASAAVRLSADHGAEYAALTDAEGRVSFPQIERGTYTVTIDAAGCNAFSQQWTIGEGTNTLSAHVTRPVIGLSQTSISESMTTEQQLTRTLTLTNRGDGKLTWYAQTAGDYTAADASRRWQDIAAFSASGDLQSSVAFDGESFYTSSYTELGMFWRYDRSGNLLEAFRMPGLYMPIYDLTYDGQYFYASDGNNYLYQLDLENRIIRDTITVEEEPNLTIMHCSWDPDRRGFWVGGSSTLGLIARDGTLMAAFDYFDSSTSMSVIGTAYDNTTPGGPYLWLADGARTSDMVDGVRLRQYTIATRSLTGESHLTTDVPGYMIGNSTYGTNSLGGICTTFDAASGRLTLIGILQQSPSLIFSYTLCDLDQWASVSPKHGSLAPGETQELTIGLNTVGADLGDKLLATATLKSLPELPETQIGINVSVDALSSTPRPVNLAATVSGDDVQLTWQKGQTTATPTYDIYRNGAKINRQPIADTTYTDSLLTFGTYQYKVRAVYNQSDLSMFSDSVAATVKQGAAHYPPVEIAASIERNSDVTLTWRSPLSYRDEASTITWADMEHVDQLGIADGGYFYAAQVWTADDLVPYRNKPIRSASILLVNTAQYVRLVIYKDGQVVYRKVYDGTIRYDGSLTTVAIDRELTIEPGSDYYFAFQVLNSSGVYPVSLDGKAAVEGKGNMLSMDGLTWMPASYQGIGGNFNILVDLGEAQSADEEEPVGYNVYRDGTLINAEPIAATTFNDVLTAPGSHSYRLSSVYANGGESARSAEVAVEVIDIGQRQAPTSIATSVRMNRDVTLRWGFPGDDGSAIEPDLTTDEATTADDLPPFVRTFEGTTMSTEMAVASDGRYIYTSVYASDGRINKYSLGGEYLETFTVDGLEGIRNMTWDGQHMWAGDNLTSIHQLDIDNHALLQSVSISEYARHMAYIPTLDGGKGGFEVGDWETSILVSRNGSKLGDGPALLGAAGTGYHDGRLYAFEQGGANAITIGVYDLESRRRVDSIDVSRYVELGSTTDYAAGGMSVIEREDGVALLAMALQSTSGYTRFVFLELSSTRGCAGYYVYRDGQLLNATPTTHRHWAESLDDEGTYAYTVATAYVDGTTSEPSQAATVTIVPKGIAPQPTDLQARQTAVGYNVALSFANPHTYDGASRSASFDNLVDGQDVNDDAWTTASSGWRATAERHYDGALAMKADSGTYAIAMAATDGATMMRLIASNGDDRQGGGAIGVIYSTDGNDLNDFIPLTTIATTEQWTESEIALPDGTEYVALVKAEATPTQYVDALRLYNAAPDDLVYGYDVYRDGRKLNATLLRGVSYVDHNLAPGTYSYQVTLTTRTAAVSEMSAPATIDVAYDNGSQAPTNLRAEAQDGESVLLTWQAPPIGEPVYIGWHDGFAADWGGLSSGGAFFAGCRWYAADLEAYQNLTLTNVRAYINQVPEALYVLVYEGRQVVRQQYIANVKQQSWNDFRLEEPLTIKPQTDYIVALYIEHNEVTVPLGYDAGPANAGRGNLQSSDGSTWTQLDEDSDIDANWCISIGLSPYAVGSEAAAAEAKEYDVDGKALAMTTGVTKSEVMGNGMTAETALTESTMSNARTAESVNSLLGYNLYRNRELVNDALIADTFYVDSEPTDARYLEYQVAAVYSLTGESFADAVTIIGLGIDNAAAQPTIVRTTPTAILIASAPSAATVTLHAADGTLRYSGKANPDGTLRIATTALPTGTYILRVDEMVVKVAR